MDCPDDINGGCSFAAVCFCNNLKTIITIEQQQACPKDSHFVMRRDVVNPG